MANIINVEKSQYLNSNIEIYAGNKVGQYSKYLDKNPLFITYFKVNSAMSRADVGTGGVNSDLGKKSPVRYNQINSLPVFNIPDLRPDAEYSENGYDIEMEINDITLLPNTIKPTPGDYLLIVLPETIEFMFRVNSFSYNTIQSNDFYQCNADLKYTGHNLIDKIKGQVVQEYETIFENIGTDDKCFILSNDIPKIQNIAKLFLELRDLYKSNFFDNQTGTFVCKNNDVTPEDCWFYDKYVEKFIMDSGIYYTNNDETSVILNCADLETPHMSMLYMQSLHYAVLNRTIDYLSSYPYYFQVDIQKILSPFHIYHIDCKGTNLVYSKNELIKGSSDGLDSGLLMEYFHHDMIHAIKGEPYDPKIEAITKEEILAILEDEWYPGYPGEEEEDDNPDNFSSEFYLDEMIYNFLTHRVIKINRKKLMTSMMDVNCYTYLTMPLAMYIIKKYYDSYFKRTEL